MALRPSILRSPPRPLPATFAPLRRKPARPPIRAGDLLPFAIPLVALATWQLATLSGAASARVLPAPGAVLQATWALVRSGELAAHAWISFRRAGVGFLVGGGLGFGLGVVNGLSRLSDRLLDTSVQMVRTVPHLALVPLVILWLGLGEEAKLFLVAIGVFFPVYLNTRHGVQAVDPGLLEMARVYGLSRRERLREVILPAALPSVLVGVRFGLGVMWLSLIVAETIGANSGIGWLAMNAREFMRTDIVLVSIVLYALLGKLADSATRVLERRCLRWDARFAAPGSAA